MKYYAFIDGSQQGPFQLEQLIGAGVRPSTYVWCKGMDDWHRADEVPDICRLFRQHLADRNHSLKSSINDEPPVIPISADNPWQQNKTRQEEQRRQMRLPFRGIQVPEPEPDYNTPPQVSMAFAVASLLLCFAPAGIAAVVFTHKSQKAWQQSLSEEPGKPVDELRKQAHEYARQAKMWLGLTVSLGIIFWTLIFSVIK